MKSGEIQNLIGEFVDFLKSKRMDICGYVISGYALEFEEYRPLAPEDLPKVIADFIKEKYEKN